MQVHELNSEAATAVRRAPFGAERRQEGRRRDGEGADAARRRSMVAAFYDEHCRQFVRDRSRYYYQRIVDRLCRIVAPRSRVLDIGCGCGDLLAAVRPEVGVGVDISAAMVGAARRRHPGLRYMQLAGEHVGRIGDTFDYVIICEMLGEVYDVPALLRAVQAVCHARTRLIVVHDSRVWQPALRLMEWLRIKRTSPERNWVPSDEVIHLLRLTNFETIRMIGMNIVPIPVPLVSHALNRFAGNLPLLEKLGLNYMIVARPVRADLIDRERPRSVSIVVPACNEAGHIRPLLASIPEIAPQQEVIFVEGGSRDDTWDVIRQAVRQYDGPFDVLCMQQDGKGKGDAVRKGFAAASGDVLMILDADISVPPEDLPQFFHSLADGQGEFINGSRMVYLMDQKAMRFLNLLGNKLFGYLFTYLLSQRFRDTLCGTKVLRRDNYDRIASTRQELGDFDPFGDFDLLFGAARLNLKIVDLPVHYRARTYGQTNISRFRHGWMLLKMCLLAARKLRFV